MATDYKWNAHSRIVDIGGAYGSFMAHLLTVNRKPRGVLFDQPQVMHDTPDVTHLCYSFLGARTAWLVLHSNLCV